MMRKLIQICRQEEFNQRTFYRWLMDQAYIQKEESGYVLGGKALSGMENLIYAFTYADGTIQERSQVTVPDELVPEILAAYANCGYERLYQNKPKNAVPKERAASAIEQQHRQLEASIQEIKNSLGEIKAMLAEVLA